MPTRRRSPKAPRPLFRPYPPRKGTWLVAIKPGSTYDGMVFQWDPTDHNAFLAHEIRRASPKEIKDAKADEAACKKTAPPAPVLKRVSANGVSAVVAFPRIQVYVKAESTDHEGGSDGGSYGDVLVKGFVGEHRGSRSRIADKLEELAHSIRNTVGDPMVSASITVLMRRPSK